MPGTRSTTTTSWCPYGRGLGRFAPGVHAAGRWSHWPHSASGAGAHCQGAPAVASGAARVNLATGALADLEWAASAIERFGSQVAVCLDVRGDVLAARGESAEVGRLWDVLPVLEEAGCARYVVTDVARDGAMSGPNTELLRKVAAAAKAPVVASGGVSSLRDIRILRGLAAVGVDSAIVGKALYNGNFTLQEALAVAGDEDKRQPSKARS